MRPGGMWRSGTSRWIPQLGSISMCLRWLSFTVTLLPTYHLTYICQISLQPTFSFLQMPQFHISVSNPREIFYDWGFSVWSYKTRTKSSRIFHPDHLKRAYNRNTTAAVTFHFSMSFFFSFWPLLHLQYTCPIAVVVIVIQWSISKGASALQDTLIDWFVCIFLVKKNIEGEKK